MKLSMNKKTLILSLVAIAILVGVSFTSVVGYNSVTSDVKASRFIGFIYEIDPERCYNVWGIALGNIEWS